MRHHLVFTCSALLFAALEGCASQQIDLGDSAPRDASADAQPDADAPNDAQSPADVPDVPVDLGGCSTGLTDCAGSCRDLASDPSNCGMCGRSCATGQRCASGMCACPAGQSLCGSACRDTASDPMNCGACGTACPSGQVCSSGACAAMCPTGQSDCGGSCRVLASDPMNCGMCGRPCPAGNTCASNACSPGMPGGADFRAQWLGTTNCRTAEHSATTGADRGGIALANTQLYYTGQTVTARFDAASLEGMALTARYDAIVSNLRTSVVYTFVDAMGTPLAPPGGMAVALREIDGATGELTPRSLPLSAPIPITGEATASSVGFFSGWDRIFVLAAGRAYNIDLPSGAVIDLGASTLPARAPCGGWGFWGVAELAARIPYIVYVADAATVVRRPLPMGPATPVSRFTNLGNMCGFTLAPGAQRWYFHHSRASQLGGSASALETVGYCDASTSVAGSMCPPDHSTCGGVCRNLRADATNCGACNTQCPPDQACISGACMGAPMRYTRSVPPVSASFIDACTAPGHGTVLTSVDDSTARVTAPFELRYWGVPVVAGASFAVSSNGYLFFGMPTALGDPSTGVIPAAAAPNGVLALQWNNLRTQADGVCFAAVGTAPDRRFAVHWSNVRNAAAAPASQMSFEAVFNERDFTIDLLYAQMMGAATATAGLENHDGTMAIGACPAGATTYSCVIPASTRWRFTPSP